MTMFICGKKMRYSHPINEIPFQLVCVSVVALYFLAVVNVITSGVLWNKNDSHFYLKVLGGKDYVYFSLDSYSIHRETYSRRTLGVHVIVLHEAQGFMMTKMKFDTRYQMEEQAFLNFIKSVQSRRIILVASLGVGVLNFSKSTFEYLHSMGLNGTEVIGLDDHWVFILHEGEAVAESYTDCDKGNGDCRHKIWISTSISKSAQRDSLCAWRDTPFNRRRQSFCEKYEGYGDLCDCLVANPLPKSLPYKTYNGVDKLPIAIIGSERPHYLYKSFQYLLTMPGLRAENVVVFLDGKDKETPDLVTLHNFTAVQNTNYLGSDIEYRVSQHYLYSLRKLFALHQSTEYAIILEDDIQISPDFFSYIDQLLPVMIQDSSIFCISSWNFQGFNSSSSDPSLVYRIQTMPGLGWVLKKSIFQKELEANWPKRKHSAWDVYVRDPRQMKGRDCLVPDISRTYHFGSRGINVDPQYQDQFLRTHSFVSTPNVKLKDVDSLEKKSYENLLIKLLTTAKILNYNNPQCSDSFVPNTQNETYVLFVQMANEKDFKNIKKLFTCFHMFDEFVGTHHHGLWRFFLKSNHILLIGIPYSPYSTVKPPDVKPLSFRKSKKGWL